MRISDWSSDVCSSDLAGMSSAVALKQDSDETEYGSGDAVHVTAIAAGQQDVLPPAALAFLVDLHQRFEPARQTRPAARRRRQARFDAGGPPHFRRSEERRVGQACGSSCDSRW